MLILIKSLQNILKSLKLSVGGVRRSPTQVLTRVTCDQRSPTQVLIRAVLQIITT